MTTVAELKTDIKTRMQQIADMYEDLWPHLIPDSCDLHMYTDAVIFDMENKTRILLERRDDVTDVDQLCRFIKYLDNIYAMVKHDLAIAQLGLSSVVASV